jgi:hypothetical protein
MHSLRFVNNKKKSRQGMSDSSLNIIRDLETQPEQNPTQMVSSSRIGKLFSREKTTDLINIPPFTREDGVGIAD